MLSNLQKEIEKTKPIPGKPLSSPTKQRQVLAAVFVKASSESAYTFFRNRRFRELIDFDSLSQTEQDRIFNELLVSALVMLMFLMEAPDLRIGQPLRGFFSAVKDEIPKQHITQLKELGVEEKYLQIWKKLVDLRLAEYEKDRLEVRYAAMQVEGKESPLTNQTMNNIQVLLPVQTVAIGCHHHIVRGKTRGKDELFKLNLKWLGNFYITIRVPLEGGKITLGSKILVKLKRWLY